MSKTLSSCKNAIFRVSARMTLEQSDSKSGPSPSLHFSEKRRSGGLRRFRRQITHRGLTGRPSFLRFDPIRLQAKHDRKKPIGTIGAQSVARAPRGRPWLFQRMTSEAFGDSGNLINRYLTSWTQRSFPGISESRPEECSPWPAKARFLA